MYGSRESRPLAFPFLKEKNREKIEGMSYLWQERRESPLLPGEVRCAH